MNQSTYQKIVEYSRTKFGVEIAFKDQSWLMKAIGFLLFFNPNFMTSYVTTIGNKIYFPSEAWIFANEDAAARVICHELIHVADEKRFGSFLFKFSYLFPQCFALGILLTLIVGPWALICLLFLLPFPAPGRAYWEFRGYAMTDAVSYFTAGSFTDIAWMSSQFTTGKYYFMMWPFSKAVNHRILKNRDDIASGRFLESNPMAKELLSFFTDVPFEK